MHDQNLLSVSAGTGLLVNLFKQEQDREKQVPESLARWKAIRQFDQFSIYFFWPVWIIHRRN